MKKKYLVFALILFVLSCSKSGSSGGDSSSTGTTGTGGTTTTPVVTPTTPSPAQNVWQLSGIAIAGVQQKITTMQSSFQMSFYSDGRYVDTDGAAGTWSYPATDSLMIAKTNLPTHITSRYKIMGKSTGSLLLRTGTGTSQLDLTYAAK